MKIFSWMQSKLNGKQTKTKPNSGSATHHMVHNSCKEEFSDWPNGLLAIGTFGNNNLQDPPKSFSQNQPEDNIISDGIKEFHKELKMLLQNDSVSIDTLVEHSFPLEEFSACLQSLQDEDSTECVHTLQKGTDIQKKSFSYLLKKTFACASGFNPIPVLRDPFPEPKLERSMMEKIMRAILHKKIYPQSSTGTKYLNNQDMSETDKEDDDLSARASVGSKWVKTDSEYIVLEI